MHWVDAVHFPQLEDQLAELDTKLRGLVDECAASPDPDGLGLFDEIEHLVGDGFFKCQHYMIHRKGTAKSVYGYGVERGSYSVARVINVAANYWKHRGEWPPESELSDYQRSTLDTVRGAGGGDSDYRLMNLFEKLCPERELTSLLPYLVEWREAMDSALASGGVVDVGPASSGRIDPVDLA